MEPIVSMIVLDNETGLPVMIDVLKMGQDGAKESVIHRAIPVPTRNGFMSSSTYVNLILPAPCGHAGCTLLTFEGCLN
jgi:hypothetical protein